MTKNYDNIFMMKTPIQKKFLKNEYVGSLWGSL